MPETEEIDPALALIQWQQDNPDVWGDQDENGVDLAHLRENLKLTPAERLRKHSRALSFARRLKEAGERHRSTH